GGEIASVGDAGHGFVPIFCCICSAGSCGLPRSRILSRGLCRVQYAEQRSDDRGSEGRIVGQREGLRADPEGQLHQSRQRIPAPLQGRRHRGQSRGLLPEPGASTVQRDHQPLPRRLREDRRPQSRQNLGGLFLK
ncbi:Expansin-like EG45 domain-containing protein, partial [Psidium guajava]